MPYLVERVVDEYGSLSAPDGVFPVRASEHDWYAPYPRIEGVIPFTWERGTLDVQPNVFWCPQVDDWVCDEQSYQLLSALAGPDLHVIAHGIMDDKPLYVIQVVGLVSGAVDESASLVDDFGSYRIMRFPSFYANLEGELASRLFRIPEMYLARFAGDLVEREFVAAGLAGLSFVGTDSSERGDGVG